MADEAKRRDGKNDNQEVLVEDARMAGALADVDWVLQCMTSASTSKRASPAGETMDERDTKRTRI